MANLKIIRNRISSIGSTKQITNAMKMVSAAKLRKAQDAILRLRPYADKIYEMLRNVSDVLASDEDNPYAVEREIKRVLIIVITSNKGLCGAFNSNVTRRALELAHSQYERLMKGGNLEFMAIGRRGFEALHRGKYNVTSEHNGIYDALNFDNVALLAQEIMTDFSAEKYDKIWLIYNQFKNAAVQVLQTEQFLPVQVPEESADILGNMPDYIFEPDKKTIVRELIPKSLKIQFYKSLLDSFASEHGARMTAMHQATDNATELMKELKLHYNKARQASITNEILEIVSGADALKG